MCIVSQCKTNVYSCDKIQMPISEFCGCVKSRCENKWNKQVLENEENEDDDGDNKLNQDYFSLQVTLKGPIQK